MRRRRGERREKDDENEGARLDLGWAEDAVVGVDELLEVLLAVLEDERELVDLVDHLHQPVLEISGGRRAGGGMEMEKADSEFSDNLASLSRLDPRGDLALNRGSRKLKSMGKGRGKRRRKERNRRGGGELGEAGAEEADLTMLAWSSSLRSEISRMAVQGTPSSSLSRRMRLRATNCLFLWEG